MDRLVTAMTLGASLLLMAGVLQVLRVNSRVEGVKDNLIPHAARNEEIIPVSSRSDIEMTTKRLAIFKKILPHPILQILVFYSTPEDGAAITAARMAGEKLAINVIERRVRSVTELKAALREMKSGAADGILHIPDKWINGHVDLIFHEAREKKIPTMTFASTYVAQGALAAYKMRGFEKMAARYYLILNLETAKQIGMTFPTKALERADEIIDRDSEKGEGHEP